MKISCEMYSIHIVEGKNDFRLGNHVCDIYLHIKKVKIWNGLWHTKIGWNAYFMAHESFLSSSLSSIFSFKDFILFFSPTFFPYQRFKANTMIFPIYPLQINDLGSSTVIICYDYVLKPQTRNNHLKCMSRFSCGNYFRRRNIKKIFFNDVNDYILAGFIEQPMNSFYNDF